MRVMEWSNWRTICVYMNTHVSIKMCKYCVNMRVHAFFLAIPTTSGNCLAWWSNYLGAHWVACNGSGSHMQTTRRFISFQQSTKRNIFCRYVHTYSIQVLTHSDIDPWVWEKDLTANFSNKASVVMDALPTPKLLVLVWPLCCVAFQLGWGPSQEGWMHKPRPPRAVQEDMVIGLTPTDHGTVDYVDKIWWRRWQSKNWPQNQWLWKIPAGVEWGGEVVDHPRTLPRHPQAPPPG